MKDVNALILTGFGLNCDYETAFAFEKAGAAAHPHLVGHAPALNVARARLAVDAWLVFGVESAAARVVEEGPADRRYHPGDERGAQERCASGQRAGVWG